MKKINLWQVGWRVFDAGRFWYFAARCWLGRPVTYRDYQGDGDWWFANCKNCNRQTEVHALGGPDIRVWLWKSWRNDG